jgi:uncharacterized protein (DUF39 family)
MQTKTIGEINEKIGDGSVRVVTADRMSEIVSELGAEEAVKEVDVVTTGTFGPMCSSGVLINFGHSEPPLKMQRVWLNDVEAYTGLAAVDAYLGAAQLSEEKGMEYGGGHAIEDLVAGKQLEMKAIGYGTDCYPRKEIETTITLDELLPNYRNATYCGAGALSPLSNDPDFETTGLGTRIFLCGASGYVVGTGTQHNPADRFGTLMVTGNLKEMSTEYLRIPIPVLNEDIAKKTGIQDADIVTEVLDYGVGRRERPVVRKVTYEELKTGMIEIEGNEVPTSPLSSFYMAKRIADELKSEIEAGEFLLSLPVGRLPTDTVLKPMKQTEELPLVKDMMIREVTTISERASIADAAKLLLETQTTHIPVVSAGNKLVGIVTAWDISTAVATQHRGLTEIMTRNVITADSDEPLELVIRKLEKYNISALPVVSKDRSVIGMVTSDEISKLIGKRRMRRWQWKLRI